MNESIIISPQHPALPGHFPGQPIVPGVVILGEVRARLAVLQPQLRIGGIRKLKFLRLLKPDESFQVQFAEPKNGGIRFKCLMCSDGSALADGHLSIEPAL